jgi:hypothetical protein
MASYNDWVLMALTGTTRITGDSPEAGDIELLATSATRELIQRFPGCLTGAPGALTGEEDKDAFNQAVGYLIASKLVMTPGGQKWVRAVLSSKQGPITESYSDPSMTPEAAQRALLEECSTALSMIECVREQVAASPRPALLTLAGRRRGLSASCGCGRY